MIVLSPWDGSVDDRRREMPRAATPAVSVLPSTFPSAAPPRAQKRHDTVRPLNIRVLSSVESTTQLEEITLSRSRLGEKTFTRHPSRTLRSDTTCLWERSATPSNGATDADGR